MLPLFRAKGSFEVVDCGGLSLVESELFGHERGAFAATNRGPSARGESWRVPIRSLFPARGHPGQDAGHSRPPRGCRSPAPGADSAYLDLATTTDTAHLVTPA